MSGYFDALLRAAGRAPSSHAAMSAPAADIVELDVEQVAAADPPARMPTPVPAAAPDTPPPRTAEAPAPVREAPRPRAHQEPPMSARPEPSGAAPLREAPAAAVATMPAPRASTANARGHAVVRAALEWVAADPGGAALPRAVAQPNERSTAALPQRDPHEVPSAHQDRSRIVVGEAPAGPIQAAPAAKASIASATARAEPGVAAAPRNLASPVDRPTAQAPRDERVEVTIGEIHILVDAPAQPAASRVASPPPAAAPRPAPEQAAARSGLARRALRRI